MLIARRFVLWLSAYRTGNVALSQMNIMAKKLPQHSLQLLTLGTSVKSDVNQDKWANRPPRSSKHRSRYTRYQSARDLQGPGTFHGISVYMAVCQLEHNDGMQHVSDYVCSRSLVGPCAL